MFDRENLLAGGTSQGPVMKRWVTLVIQVQISMTNRAGKQIQYRAFHSSLLIRLMQQTENMCDYLIINIYRSNPKVNPLIR